MEKLNMQSLNIVGSNIKKIQQLFPNCVTERKGKDGKTELAIDFEKLQAELSDDIIGVGEERYQFTWPDKRAANRLANTPTSMTLRPCREDSVDFDKTQNIYIEGDNLDVLKVLRETYLGKVKMIYIDPPYNTGNDFVYNDGFAKGKGEFEQTSGFFDEEGNQTVDPMQRNMESNGRFHTDWLNMMYPRLKVARDLLSDDGVIFISIDDNEVDNLRKICDEIFGSNNRLDRGELIWINKGSTKGFNKIVKNHEYIIAYGKNANNVNSYYGLNRNDELDKLEHYCYNKPSSKNPFSDIKFKKGCKIEGVDDIEFVDHVGDEVQLKIINGKMIFKDGILQDDVILRGTFPYKNQIEHYFKYQSKGIPTYDYKGQKWIEIFFNKKGLPRYRKERNTQIISSVIDYPEIPNYGSEDIISLFGKKEIFNFPKPHQLILHLMCYFLNSNSLVLDFFSGSATVAHSLLKMNALYGGNHRFIMVQLPELTDKNSEAYKAGFKNICEIGEERIRRAGKQIIDELTSEVETKERLLDRILNAEPSETVKMLPVEEQKEFAKKVYEEKAVPLINEIDEIKERIDNLDTGFRVFKLDTSNMEDVYYTPQEFDEQNLFADNVKPDRTNEDLLFQVMLDLGIELSVKIEMKEIAGKTVHMVDGNYLIACFDENVNETTIKEIAKLKPVYFVMRDTSAANDNVIDNFEQIFRHYSPDTTCRII